jgi:hypothetical protein
MNVDPLDDIDVGRKCGLAGMRASPSVAAPVDPGVADGQRVSCAGVPATLVRTAAAMSCTIARRDGPQEGRGRLTAAPIATTFPEPSGVIS